MIRSAIALSALALAACDPAASSAKAKAEPGAAPAPASQAAPDRVAAMPSETRTFRDWWAVCDNGNACSAYGFGSDDGAAWIRIEMPPGPDAEPRVTFGSFVPEGEGRRNLAVIVDGRPFAGTLAPDADGDIWVGQISARTRQAVTAIAAARRLQIQTDQVADISSSGASAALLWIDERQGRLNTTTALLRRGDLAASNVPGAPVLPAVRAAAAVDQAGFGGEGATLPAPVAALPAVRECLGDSNDNEWLLRDVRSARLGARAELWGVPCGAGAYNITHAWFVTGPGGANPRPANLAGTGGPVLGEDWSNNMTVNGAYDAADRQISAFAKSRGLGDCGVAQTWTWTGTQFELAQEQVMENCSGVLPTYWPTTWRSQ